MNKADLSKQADELEPRVGQVLRDEIKALHAYRIPDSTGMIKLDAMENPYVMPEQMIDAWLQSLRKVSLNRYPDPTGAAVIENIRTVMGIDEQFDLLLGNGSDEIIQLLCTAVAKPGAVVLSPTPGFVMYEMIAKFCGLQFVGVPLAENFRLNEQAMCKAIEQYNPALVFISSPNNPTGNLFDLSVVQKIIKASQGIVVIDEAYYVFASSNALLWLQQYPNLLIMRTLSKLGLAGIRLGMLIGQRACLQEINKMRLPYNINSLTQASAVFMLQNWQVLQQQIQRITHERERIAGELSAIKGITVYPSEANFILLRAPSGTAEIIFNALKKRKILVKCLSNATSLKDCLRVTVGTAEENNLFLKNMREIVKTLSETLDGTA